MRRRDFMAGIGAAALAPFAARAQGAVPKIGWLKIQDKDDTPGWLAAFRDGLRSLGNAEGREFALLERYADGDASRLAALAESLVQAGSDIIVATSQPATDAARRVTQRVPIVGRMTDDPVETRTARSLARPAGNVTGVYSLLEEMSGKRLALLQAAAPGIRRVGALLTLDRGATRHWLAETEKAAQQLGLSVHPMDVHAPDDLEGLFAAAPTHKVDALLAFRNPTIVTHARRVIELANRYRMPAVFDAREYADAGALMSYGPNLDEIFRHMAVYVDKILKGANPGDLPIEQPTKLELVINLRTAKAIGLSLPAALLATADEVIE